MITIFDPRNALSWHFLTSCNPRASVQVRFTLNRANLTRLLVSGRCTDSWDCLLGLCKKSLNVIKKIKKN